MKRNLLLFLFSGVLLPTLAHAADAQLWKLPLALNESNAKVQFDVDTTWHVVTGHVREVTGTVSQREPNNPLSIDAEIHFPVKAFDTGWDMRDESLFEHMDEPKFPEVVLRIRSVEGVCELQLVQTVPCKVLLKGSLSITDVTKDVALDARIEAVPTGFKVSGETTFEWASYKVKDPSMAVAKVEPQVKVSYAVILPAAASQ